MFEGWVSDLLASYLGHFLDVKKEQLRVSLWRGQCKAVGFLLAWGQKARALQTACCRFQLRVFLHPVGLHVSLSATA